MFPSTSRLRRAAGSASMAATSTGTPTVMRGSQDLDNWIPEVARNLATLNLHASKPPLGTFSLQGRLSGHMFDDDANNYLLHGYFRLDAYASHDFGSRFQILPPVKILPIAKSRIRRLPQSH